MSNSGTPARRPKAKGLIGAVITVGTLLLAALVALALALSGLISIPGITQATGEVVLQGVDELGLDPFSDTALAEASTGTTPAPAAQPTVTTASAQVSGGATGLYGGTGDNSVCDPAKLVTFLGSNPDKAKAWIDALNADPALRWGNNQPLTIADIPGYVSQLTSLVLLTDTAVTNHGFSNGRATPFVSVLQAGTAVLVDRFGVPRARCFCGNPLLPGSPLPADPTLTGTPWPGFDPKTVVNVVNVVNVINVFNVVPVPGGGAPIPVPAGLCDPADPTTCGAPGPTGFVPTNAPTAAPTPAPTEVPADWVPVPPTGVPASPGTSDVAADLTVVNETNSIVDVYWSDFSGVPMFYGSLAPGESLFVQQTFEGHIWTATSGTPDPLSVYTATAGSQTFTVR